MLRGNVIVCDCGNVLGISVPVNGEQWIEAGGVQLRSAHGRCTDCLKLWHFDALDGKFDDLVRRLVDGKNDYRVG